MIRTFPPFGYNPVTGEWNDSLARDCLWSNVNVSEAVPDVMTPSTWSLWWIFHYETNPVEFPGDDRTCGNICGRPYLNLSLLVSVYRAIGMDARKQMQGELVGSIPQNLDIPMIPFSTWDVYSRVLPKVIQAHLQMSRAQKQVPQFLATTPGWYASSRQSIQNCRDAAALLSLWREGIRPIILHACRMLRSVTHDLAEPATPLHKELNTLVGESDANAILSNLSGDSANLESLGPLVGLANVRDGKLSCQEYLQRYGHRGPHEMELFAPGAEDDPDWLERKLAEFSFSAAEIETILKNQRAEASAAWQRFEKRFPKKAAATRRRLEIVAAAARNREAVRSEVTRGARLVRIFLLRAGELTGLGEGVFFLSLDETAAVLAGDKTPASRTRARQEMYNRQRALPPYPALIIGRFDPFQWASDPQRRSDLFDARQNQPPAPLAAAISGIGGSVGVVEGIVRRLDRPEDGNQLQPGEILVTVNTNIGWTPLFPRLAAIVTDVGAPLSHAAIVARELGIPAVVGCGNATMRLKTGDRVRVDGGAGKVTVIQP